MIKYKTFFLSLSTCWVVLAFIAASSAFAQTNNDAKTQINAANQLVREGKITEAIDAYSEIGPVDGQDANLNYNLGIAHYRNGDAEAASTLFSKVAGSPNKTLASNSQYNLGNCRYSKALKQLEADKPAAISSLKDAISFYRSSLRGNPGNSDARANIELAGELIKQLKEEQDQQDQDQQDQDQQDQDQQDQDQQDQDQQNQDQQNQDQQNQDQQNQDQQNQDQQNQDQSEDSDSDNSADKSQQQPPQQDSKNKNPDNPDDKQQQPDNKSQSAEEPSDSSDENEKQQSVPSGELKAANEQDEKDDSGMVAGEAQENKDGLMTREEALKMLQSVRDRDMLRRLKQQQRERSRRVPVDRDW